MKTRLIAATAATVGACALVILGGCGNHSEGNKTSAAETNASLSTPPTLDISTPDRAVKSSWAVVDWKRTIERTAGAKYSKSAEFVAVASAAAKVNSKAITDANAPGPDVVELYGRDIVQAIIETESRATVIAQIKNVTPIAASVVLDKYQQTTRDEGDRIKYVLEKDQDGWKVAEIWVWDSYSKQFQKRRPHTSASPPIYVYSAW